MIEIQLSEQAPKIAETISKRLHRIKNKENCSLGLQLSYRENSTIFDLNKVQLINFDDYYIEIQQINNSSCYLNYVEILEYFIMPTEDIIGSEYL